MPELARHEVGVFGHRAKRVQRCQRPTINDFDDLRSTLSMMDWSTINIRAARPTCRTPFADLKPLFRLPTSASKSDAFRSPKIQPKSPKKLPKPSQNGSQIAYYVPTPEMFKNGTTMVRKPHFGSLLALRNRFKIDAKTPSKSALCWIPSWNPKKYDF